MFRDLVQEFGPRDAMAYDIVIVGAGPAGLATAIRLKQLAALGGGEVSVAVLEKGSEPGALALHGAPGLAGATATAPHVQGRRTAGPARAGRR